MLKDTSAILNPRLLAALAGAGHTDTIVIADAGLPIPRGPELIDLSVVDGLPSFLQVLDAVRAAFCYEAAVMAREAGSAPLYSAIRERLEGIPLEELPHVEFKARTAAARAVVRTGERTPYSNLLLVAGVNF